jgi:membrane protein DedA with SNARE-associated domain
VIPQTGIAVIDWFLAALESWGYLIVFGFTIFENLFVVGSFTPGETVVIAGALVASQDSLAIGGVWLASVAGTILGSNISYWLGRRAGLSSVKAFTERIAATRIGRIFRIDAEGLEEVHEHFHTQGAKTVLISRFAIGAKNFVPAVAGATEMPVFWYELYTVLGAMLYTTIMCSIGWFLGANLDLALTVASGVGYVGLAIMALFVGGILVARNRIKARRDKRDEEQ